MTKRCEEGGRREISSLPLFERRLKLAYREIAVVHEAKASHYILNDVPARHEH